MNVYNDKWRRTIKEVLQRLLTPVPLELIKKRFKYIPVGIVYHIVSDEHVPHISNIFSYRNVEKFEEDIVFLKNNFTLLSYKELVSHIVDGKPFPEFPAFISFDDGLRESFTCARPILKKHNVPCIFFVTTDFLDNKKMFFRHKISLCIDRLKDCPQEALDKVINTIKQRLKITVKSRHEAEITLRLCGLNCFEIADEVGEALNIDFSDYARLVKPYMTSQEISIMLSEGFNIGSHGKTHNFLGKASYEGLVKEIKESSDFLNRKFGINKMGFSFPFSARGIDHNWLRSILTTSKYIELFFGSEGVGLEEDYIVNRIGCDFSSTKDAKKVGISNLIKLYLIRHQLLH